MSDKNSSEITTKCLRLNFISVLARNAFSLWCLKSGEKSRSVAKSYMKEKNKNYRLKHKHVGRFENIYFRSQQDPVDETRNYRARSIVGVCGLWKGGGSHMSAATGKTSRSRRCIKVWRRVRLKSEVVPEFPSNHPGGVFLLHLVSFKAFSWEGMTEMNVFFNCLPFELICSKMNVWFDWLPTKSICSIKTFLWPTSHKIHSLICWFSLLHTSSIFRKHTRVTAVSWETTLRTSLCHEKLKRLVRRRLQNTPGAGGSCIACYCKSALVHANMHSPH